MVMFSQGTQSPVEAPTNDVLLVSDTDSPPELAGAMLGGVLGTLGTAWATAGAGGVPAPAGAGGGVGAAGFDITDPIGGSSITTSPVSYTQYCFPSGRKYCVRVVPPSVIEIVCCAS